MAGTTDALSIDAFGRRLRARETTSREATADCLRRIQEEDGRLNAFIRVMSDDALAQAEAADRELAAGVDRGPLHGVPMSVKDLLDVRGVPTTAASHVRDGHVATGDAAAVAHLRRAGAVIIGKTNLHEFAFGTTTEDSAFGPTRNPYDLTRSPGGSSGGSAVSVAAGMAFATIGTDTGGSIRIPAAACGIVGLKPTLGEVSTEGVVPLSRGLDHVGPLARSVTDAWLVLQGLAGAYGGGGDDGRRRVPAPVPVSSLRLGVLRPYFCDLLEDDVRARFEASLQRLRQAGARIEDAAIPHAGSTASIYLILVLADAVAYHGPTLDSVPERYTRPVRSRLELGRYVLAEDYVRALHGRDVLTREVDAALAACDALVLPTLPIAAPPIGADSTTIAGVAQPIRALMLRLTQLFNLTGHPAVSVPCGRTSAGLPCGFQLVGGRMRTGALVRTALACEPHVSS
jgi:aspartyl-tRNA(Asn)/glutamyl-tRNA(Gln) amidotransferase subunit A